MLLPKRELGVIGIAALVASGCASDESTGPGSGGAAGMTCQSGQTACGTSCVSLDRDPGNCGACGKACPTGTTCTASVCACQAGLTPCGDDCVDLTSDPGNCGSCGAACTGDLVCSESKCSANCAEGLTNCGGACVDPEVSASNCGACGAACPGGSTCSAGACVCGVGQLCAGACVDVATDANNCGACGVTCASGSACVAGACSGGTAGSGGSGATGGTPGTGASVGTGGSAATGATAGTGAAAGTGGSSGTGGIAGTGGGETLSCTTAPNPGEGGVVIDGCCVVLCANGDLTDADANGALDGWGWEMQAECAVPGSMVATGKDACLPDARTDLPPAGDGYWFPSVGDAGTPACLPPCDDAATADPDGDGWGWEYQASCIVVGSVAAAQGIPCIPETETCTGNGYVTADAAGNPTCTPPCQYGSLTDVDATTCAPDTVAPGWGWENGATCLVPGAAAAPASLCCTLAARTGLPAAGTGYMADIDESGVYGDSAEEVCMPACSDGVTVADSCTWGYENGQNCIVAGSVAAAGLVPCVYEALTTAPPTGDGWNGDYTTTFFGQADCSSLGATDFGNTNLDQSVCVGSNTTTLDSSNQTWFGALGDLSTYWTASGTCSCPGGTEPCVPTCPTDTCSLCFEVACNPGGTYYYPDDPTQDTHNGLCNVDQSVVVQIIDVCPHNHSNNTYWCTTERTNHIDISCSAFTALTNGRQDIDNIGSLNAWVRQVDCSVGLGVHTITH